MSNHRSAVVLQRPKDIREFAAGKLNNCNLVYFLLRKLLNRILQ